MQDQQGKEQKVVGTKFEGFTNFDANLQKPIILTGLKMTMRKVTMVAGPNNSGKSFIQKLIWAGAYIFTTRVLHQRLGIPETKPIEEAMQFVLNNTFYDQDLDGSFKLYHDPFYSISIEIDKGKVTKVETIFPTDMELMRPPLYLSKDSRQFTSLSKYLAMRKALGITTLNTDVDLNKLTAVYKLYDIVTFEMMQNKLETGNTAKTFTKLRSLKGVDSELSEMLDDVDITAIKYNTKEQEVYVINKAGEEKRIRTQGEGVQSLLMMLLVI